MKNLLRFASISIIMVTGLLLSGFTPFAFFRTYKPVLDYDFLSSTSVPAEITFTRSSTATYYNNSGVLSTAATNAARFDYDPSTLTLRGLLMEPGATNLFPYSEQTAATMSYQVGFSNNAVAAPDSTITADKVIPTTVTGQHQVYIVQSVPTGTQYTFSLYAKAAGYNYIAVGLDNNAFSAGLAYVLFNLATATYSNYLGIPNGAGIQAVGNGWYRVWITNTSTTADTAGATVVIFNNTPALSYAGDGTSGVYLWGFQLETGNAPSSYIPTAASAVTRSADKAQLSAMSWYRMESGSLFAQYMNQSSDSSSTYRIFGLFGSDVSGTFSQNSVDISDSGNVNKSSVTASSVTQYNPAGTVSIAGFVNKVALGYSDGSFSFAANNGTINTQSSGSVPSAATTAYIGSQPDGKMRGRWIQKIRYYNEKAQDAFLRGLTQ